jgi:hypothetical protein
VNGFDKQQEFSPASGLASVAARSDKLEPLPFSSRAFNFLPRSLAIKAAMSS